MRRHFSIQRLAIVVVWAVLSPQGALLVQSWTSVFRGAVGFDASGIAGIFDGGWNRWTEFPGAVAKNRVVNNAVAKNLGANFAVAKNFGTNNAVAKETAAKTSVVGRAADQQTTTESVVFDWSNEAASDQAFAALLARPLAERASALGAFPSARDLAADRFPTLRPLDVRRDCDLRGVVIR
jgi:hypothetical protein